MHPAAGQAADSDEPRTRCWLGLRASYGLAARARRRSAPTHSRRARHRPARCPARTGVARGRRYREPTTCPATPPEVPMSQHPRAGQPALPSELVDVPALLRAYDEIRPDPSDPTQRVAFGTSGHRGSAFRAAFNEAHILATTEAICRYRAAQGYTGPLFIGRDTHALSRARLADGARGAGRERRRRARRQRGRLHADAGASRTRSSCANRGRPGGPRGRHRRHPVAQPARRRRLQVQPAQRRPGRHRRHDVDPGRGEPDPGGVGRRRARRHPRACPSSGRGRRPGTYDFRGTYVADLANVIDMAAIARVRPAAGRGPAGRRGGRVLGPDRRAVRPRPHGHQRDRRPDRSGS